MWDETTQKRLREDPKDIQTLRYSSYCSKCRSNSEGSVIRHILYKPDPGRVQKYAGLPASRNDDTLRNLDKHIRYHDAHRGCALPIRFPYRIHVA